MSLSLAALCGACWWAYSARDWLKFFNNDRGRTVITQNWLSVAHWRLNNIHFISSPKGEQTFMQIIAIKAFTIFLLTLAKLSFSSPLYHLRSEWLRTSGSRESGRTGFGWRTWSRWGRRTRNWRTNSLPCSPKNCPRARPPTPAQPKTRDPMERSVCSYRIIGSQWWKVCERVSVCVWYVESVIFANIFLLL